MTRSTRVVLEEMFSKFDDGTTTAYGSDDFLDMVANDCDWREESTDPRFAGRHGDREALVLGVRTSTTTLRDRHAVIHEMIVEETRAAVIWEWSARQASDSSALSARVFTLFTVSGGLIRRWHDQILPNPSSPE